MVVGKKYNMVSHAITVRISSKRVVKEGSLRDLYESMARKVVETISSIVMGVKERAKSK